MSVFYLIVFVLQFNCIIDFFFDWGVEVIMKGMRGIISQ